MNLPSSFHALIFDEIFITLSLTPCVIPVVECKVLNLPELPNSHLRKFYIIKNMWKYILVCSFLFNFLLCVKSFSQYTTCEFSTVNIQLTIQFSENLVSSGACTHPWWIQVTFTMPVSLGNSCLSESLLPILRQLLICFLSQEISLHFVEFYINALHTFVCLAYLSIIILGYTHALCV